MLKILMWVINCHHIQILVLTLIHSMLICSYRIIPLPPLPYRSSSMYNSVHCFLARIQLRWATTEHLKERGATQTKQMHLKVIEKEDIIHAIYLAFFFFNFSFSFVKISSCPVYSADHLCVKLYNPTTATLLSAFSKTPFCPFWFWKIADKHQL